MLEDSSTAAFPNAKPVEDSGEKTFVSNLRKKQFEYLENPLPNYAYVYFDHLKAEYENQLISGAPEKALQTIKQIYEKRGTSTLTWSDIYAYDSIFTPLLKEEYLPRKTWELRNRYRDIVGLKEYEAYLASKPPDISGEVKSNDLIADMEFLLNKIYLHYSLIPFIEKLRNTISNKVTIFVLMGMALIVLTGAISVFANLELKRATILMVLYAGAMGGLMSMLQRYNNLGWEGDPINNMPGLTQYWSRIFIPAINGALFAALLYMIIIGDLIDGSIFPDIVGHEADGDGIGIFELLTGFGPAKGVDYAKLIVWGFIAGFAERFVPDTLTKIVSNKEKEKLGKS